MNIYRVTRIFPAFEMLTSGVYFYVLLFLTTVMRLRAVHVQPLCSCTQPDPSFANGVNLVYYNCDEISTTVAFPIDMPQDLLNVLSTDKRTIIYIFGYTEEPQQMNIQIMIKALCYGRTDNVVLLDWSKHSNGTYRTVFQHAEQVGSLFANSIRLLKDRGFDVSKLYIIGHSLGAHIAGFAGKCNYFVIPRITGLDPANHIFYPLGCYLTSKDAMWIDIIHTDMGIYGTTVNSGTADYYVNGGFRPQPGCRLINVPMSDADFCSHRRSVEIYAASKYRLNEFTATQCASFRSYTKGDCNKNLQTGVGYAASNIRGSFYFNTGTFV